MKEILLYLLATSLYQGIFFVLYHFLLRKEVGYGMNRLFLLLALPATFLLPFCRFGRAETSQFFNQNVFGQEEAPALHQWVGGLSATEVSVSGLGVKWVFCLWAMIAALLFLRYLIGLIQLGTLISAQPRKRENRFRIILVAPPYTASSFFHYIFMPSHLVSKDLFSLILDHEKQHARYLHSLDLILVNLTLVVYWFNPVLYAWKTALQEVHEFQVDRALLANTPFG